MSLTPLMRTALPPRVALARIRQLCNLIVAGIWLYQGLVPKLLGPHPDEVAMSSAWGIPLHLQTVVSYAAGAGEMLLGLCVLVFSRHTWPQWVSGVVTALLLAFVVVYTPHFLVGAFNPVVMNGASMALSVIALLAGRAEGSLAS